MPAELSTGDSPGPQPAEPPAAPAWRRAVIDIGTNSVKLLVADGSDRSVQPVLERSEPTRLGSGFYETHRLRSEVIQHTAEVVREFSGEARRAGAASLRIIATSAARDALNRAELIAAVESASGHRLEIITGEQEALWAYRGVARDPRHAGGPLLILDVGGGSTEFVLGEGDHLHFRNSFRLGAVRLLERFQPADPPAEADLVRCRHWLRDFLRTEIRPELQPMLATLNPTRPRLVGTGGTASILVSMELGLTSYDRERIEATVLSRAQLAGRMAQLWRLSLAARRQLAGLPPNRADVILTGAAIYEAVMEEFGFGELRVSTRGMRFAALMDPG
jgi:exopolyphosphatase/guanosine-5'-triphosphate,3'-diphosphate pyrophosphatase